MAGEGIRYTVKDGDTTASLAFKAGLFWETVWDHAENSDLKQRRKDQNTLLPGDVIFIPEIEPKEESAATAQKHRYRLKGVPEKLRLQLLNLENKPLANEPYRLFIDDRPAIEGSLDGQGVLEHFVPPDAREGRLLVGRNAAWGDYTLKFGHLHPLDELSGVQRRLANLGYYSGAVDGTDNKRLRDAVRAFRMDFGMKPTGTISKQFLDKLAEIHDQWGAT